MTKDEETKFDEKENKIEDDTVLKKESDENGASDQQLNETSNETLNGTLNLTSNGTLNGTLNGKFNGNLNGTLNGNLNEAINETLISTLNGTLNDTIDDDETSEREVFDPDSWIRFYLDLKQEPFECPLCLADPESAKANTRNQGRFGSRIGAKQHFTYYNHNIWKYHKEVQAERGTIPTQWLPKGLKNPTGSIVGDSDSRSSIASFRVSGERRKKRKKKAGMIYSSKYKARKMLHARDQRRMSDLSNSDYESFQNSPVPGGLNPKDLPGNRNSKSREITVLPSIHGRSPQKSRLGGPAVSLEVRNPNMRESTLTWSESQRQVEIDRREIGEKCPREDRLERLDILNHFDVESIETDLIEYFPEESFKLESNKIPDKAPKKIEPVNDINSEEEADRILAEQEQEKLFSVRKQEILHNSPSRHTRTRSRSHDTDTSKTDTSKTTITINKSPTKNTPLKSPTKRILHKTNSPSKRKTCKPKRLFTIANLPKDGELPAVQFVSNLTNDNRKVTLSENYFFHNEISPERVHKSGCGPKTPSKMAVTRGGKSVRKSSSESHESGMSDKLLSHIHDDTINLYTEHSVYDDSIVEDDSDDLEPTMKLGRAIEYDLDDEDIAWLQAINKRRNLNGFAEVKEFLMEYLIDELERESVFDLGKEKNSFYDPSSSTVLKSPELAGKEGNNNKIAPKIEKSKPEKSKPEKSDKKMQKETHVQRFHCFESIRRAMPRRRSGVLCLRERRLLRPQSDTFL